MSDELKKEDSFENSVHSLFGCLVQGFLIFVLIANIIAYAFSEKYRSMIRPGKFVISVLAFSALTFAFWWIMRKTTGRPPAEK